MVSWSQQLAEAQEGFREWLPPAVRDLPPWSWLTAGAVVLASLWYLRRKRRRLPPGPMGVPLMGAVNCIGHDMHLDFMKLRETYGDIFSFSLFGRLHVALHSYSLIKEALLTRPDFADVPVFNITTLAGFNHEITLMQYGDQLKSARKFMTMAMKRLGIGGSGIAEDKVLTEIGHILEFLRDSDGSPIQLTKAIKHGLARALSSIVYSQEYSKDDPEADRLVDLIHDWYSIVFSQEMWTTEMFPHWLGKIFYKKAIDDATAMNKKISGYIQEKIDEHRATLDKNNLRDIVDIYLAEREDLDEEKLAYAIVAFMPDGVDTLSSVIIWALLYITHSPEVQDEIQKELDAVVGRSGRPTMAHRKDLLYLQATILEVYRITNLLPTAVPHLNLRDTTLAGYNIPANTMIWPNIFSVHMDPETFPNPDKFDPRHFIDEKGQLKNTERCIPFGIGRRSCLGEQLSKMESFLFLSNILHQFRLSFPPDQAEPSLVPHKIGAVLKFPEEFSVIALPR